MEIQRFEINGDGKIVVVAAKLPETSSDAGDERNEWDKAT